MFSIPPRRRANLIRLWIGSTRENPLAMLCCEEAERLHTGQILGNLLKIGTEIREWARESETGEPHSCAEER